MSKVTLARIIVLSYLTFLPRILTYWPLTVLPLIIRNNWNIKDPEEISKYAGHFFTSFLYGGITGAIIWPYIVTKVSKRNCLIIGIIGQGIFNSLQGSTTDVKTILIIRFIAGLFNNIVTVGKDFVFDVSKDEKYRIYGFSIGSCFTMFGLFFGPYIGYKIYFYTGQSFAQTCQILIFFYIIAAFSFWIFFYLCDFHHHKINRRTTIDIETQEKIKRTIE